MAIIRLVTMIFAISIMVSTSSGIGIHQLRLLMAQRNMTSMLVFGDSSVDPGNNNVLRTSMKANFPPYGKDFFGGLPTGRFSDGRLAPDLLAEVFGFSNVIPGYLDRSKNRIGIMRGVSFASAGSGYDELTANLSGVLSIPKQLEYLRHYKIELRRLVGKEKAEEIVKGAIFLISMGTNDFLQNYYLEPIRPKKYTLEEYQNFLISRMVDNVMEMKKEGARRLVVVGLPPLGCMPLVKFLKGGNQCVAPYNQAAFTFNSKIKQKLDELRAASTISTAFADAYGIIKNAIDNPKKFGFTETSKGCCGTGTVEYGDTCRDLSTCTNPSTYVFWDAVHPSQKMYKVIADEVIKSLEFNIFN